MELHHKLRRDPNWHPSGCNICGQVRADSLPLLACQFALHRQFCVCKLDDALAQKTFLHHYSLLRCISRATFSSLPYQKQMMAALALRSYSRLPPCRYGPLLPLCVPHGCYLASL